ncbi:hypothetical protein H0H81_010139 [Sphagnurus paluster]|uniref:Uncharacterized protein n=1 Tax=Sphagnurus paluster TaxID=117069 RepID=A0A9P7FRP8_9AGAR|nr:hypothetical protein H0H81_010139 [Sphagnurus paluster]
MRTRHAPHAVPGFPVYSSSFISENELVLGGGGGQSRSGVKNKLRLYKVGSETSFELLDEFELEKGEDAPMSMAAHVETGTIICGVNSALEKLEKGENDNCRVISVQEHKYVTVQAPGGTKVTVLCPDGTLLAVAGSHDLSVLSYPTLAPVFAPIHTEKEIYDASFSATTLVIATTTALLVYALPASKEAISVFYPADDKGKGKAKKAVSENQTELLKLELLQTVEVPASVGGVAAGATFRAASVINVSPPRNRKGSSSSRQSFICKWNAKTWMTDKTRKIGDRGVTCFDIR